MAQDSTVALRVVPKENVSKLTGLVIKSALLALIIFSSFLLTTKFNNPPQSKLIISANQNKFDVNFNLQEKDLRDFSKVLENLQVSQDLLKGAEFKLDNNSSVKLALASPIEINLEPKENEIRVSGVSQAPLIYQFLNSPAGFKMPQNTNYALYSKDLSQFVTKNLQMGPDFKTWFEQTTKSEEGEYLIGADNANFYLVLKPKETPNFIKLQELPSATQDQLYKQEIENNTNIHLFKTGTEEKTLAFFEQSGMLYVTNSLEKAKEMIAIQKGEEPYILFPQTPQEISFALFVANKNGNPSKSLAFIDPNIQKFSKYTEKVKEGLVVLAEKQISGYIKF